MLVKSKLIFGAKRLMRLAEQADNEKTDDGLDIPSEISRREILLDKLSVAIDGL